MLVNTPNNRFFENSRRQSY